MLSYNDKISLRQLQALLILDIFGTGVTVLPRTVSQFAGQDGWLCVILATAAIVVAVAIITALAGLFPGKSFFQYSGEILSKPIGTLVSLGLVVKILVTSALQLRLFGEIVRHTLLSSTPFVVICLVMLLVSAYAAAKGYETRARIAEILVFIVLLPIIFVIGVAATETDFTNLMPFFNASPENVAKGSLAACFAFNGVELLLLVFPYLNRTKHAMKSSITAVVALGILMCLVTVATIARFGSDELNTRLWPVIEMMDTLDAPGSLVERQGALIMSFWIVSIFAAVNAGMFFSSLLMKDIVKKGRHSVYILIFIPLALGLSLLPGNLSNTYQYIEFMNYTFGIAYMLAIPLIMLAIAKIRGLGKTNG